MKKVTMTQSNIIVALLGLGAVLGSIVMLVTIFTTTPKQLGPGGVTFWFIALFISLSCIFSLLLLLIKVKIRPSNTTWHHKVVSSTRTGVLVGLGLVGFLALRSLGTLDIKDIILLSLVLFLIELYLRTRKDHYEAT